MPGTNKIHQPYYNLKMYLSTKFWPTTNTYYTVQVADYKTLRLTTVLALVSAFSYPYPQKSARGKPNQIGTNML
jgi:hypothetical protein